MCHDNSIKLRNSRPLWRNVERTSANLQHEHTARPYRKQHGIHKYLRERSDVKPNDSNQNATLDITVKWRLKPRMFFYARDPQNQWPLSNGLFGESSHLPCANSPREGYLRPQDTSCTCINKTAGRSSRRTTQETANSVRLSFLRRRRKTTRPASSKLHLPLSTAWKILRKCLAGRS